MTGAQIQTYEYCKKYLADIDSYIEKLPIPIQKYGCSSGSPQIEHQLEKLHRKMRDEILDVLVCAKAQIQSKIDNL